MAAKQVPPAVELAEKIHRLLETRRQAGESALTLRDLASMADPQAPPELALAALSREPLKSHGLLARKKDPNSLFCLVEDKARLAQDPRLLVSALHAVCTKAKPLCAVVDLPRKASLDPALHEDLVASVTDRLGANNLPPEVGRVDVKGKTHLFLVEMPPPKAPEIVLIERWLGHLEQARAAGGEAYPLPLAQLRSAIPAEDKIAKKALARPEFAQGVLVAEPRQPNAPVALRQDLSTLASSAILLHFVLERHCTPSRRLHPPEKLAARLVSELQGPFVAAVEQQVSAATLPSFAGATQVLGKTHLYFQHLAPLPPPKKPEVQLAEQILETLRLQKSETASSVTSLRAVLDKTGSWESGVVRKALASPTLREGILTAVKNHPDPPLALAEDAVELATSDLLLEFLLRGARAEANQGLKAADLKKSLLPQLQGLFVDSLDQRAAKGALPLSLGWLSLKGAKVFFFLQDVHRGSASPPPPRPTPSDQDLPGRIEEAFRRLDHNLGGNNFVSLLDLRQAVAGERAAFDAALESLRHAGRLTLSAAEGRHGLSEEARAAGIVEDGILLLFVSRRSP